MRNKTLRFAIEFSRACRVYKLNETELAQLIKLAQLAFKANERACNEQYDSDKQCKSVKDHAKMMGLTVSWPGLYPRFSISGVDVYLPTLD